MLQGPHQYIEIEEFVYAIFTTKDKRNIKFFFKSFSYKRDEPVGLISFSFNWVILHNAIDSMNIKIQLNLTGI